MNLNELWKLEEQYQSYVQKHLENKFKITENDFFKQITPFYLQKTVREAQLAFPFPHLRQGLRGKKTKAVALFAFYSLPNTPQCATIYGQNIYP